METRRCVLMEIEETDYEEFRNLNLNNDVRRHLGGVQEEEYIANSFRDALSSHDAIYWVAREKATHDFIGILSLDRHHDGETEVSYQLMPGWWGRGYGKELVEKVLAYGFEQWKLSGMVAETQTSNRNSTKLLESLGFTIREKVVRYGKEQTIYDIRRTTGDMV